ncbi:hypothetical protein GLOIN_2v1493935, partial [Rhizophagus irregularis DAOM 181602=DAOM 197198]
FIIFLVFILKKLRHVIVYFFFFGKGYPKLNKDILFLIFEELHYFPKKNIPNLTKIFFS